MATTSSGRTALRRLQQSHARDHHHAEYANGFHNLFYDSMSPPANKTINLLRLALWAARPLSAGITVKQSVDAFVGAGGTEQVAEKLTKTGLLLSVSGSSGGYKLARRSTRATRDSR